MMKEFAGNLKNIFSAMATSWVSKEHNSGTRYPACLNSSSPRGSSKVRLRGVSEGFRTTTNASPLPYRARASSYIDRMLELSGEDGFSQEGCKPATGFMGSTLFWLKEKHKIPTEVSKACFMPDYVTMK